MNLWALLLSSSLHPCFAIRSFFPFLFFVFVFLFRLWSSCLFPPSFYSRHAFFLSTELVIIPLPLIQPYSISSQPGYDLIALHFDKLFIGSYSFGAVFSLGFRVSPFPRLSPSPLPFPFCCLFGFVALFCFSFLSPSPPLAFCPFPPLSVCFVFPPALLSFVLFSFFFSFLFLYI